MMFLYPAPLHLGKKITVWPVISVIQYMNFLFENISIASALPLETHN